MRPSMAVGEMEPPCAWQLWAGWRRRRPKCWILAAAQAAVSHDHPDAIAAAQTVALSIFLLWKNVAPRAVRERLTSEFRYDLSPERAPGQGGLTYRPRARCRLLSPHHS